MLLNKFDCRYVFMMAAPQALKYKRMSVVCFYQKGRDAAANVQIAK